MLELVDGLPLTEEYDSVPDIQLPNNEARADGDEVIACAYYIIGMTNNKNKLIVVDNLYDEYANYYEWDVNTIISLTCVRDGKICKVRNINELCMCDRINVIVSKSNWESSEFEKKTKRSPYLDKEETRKAKKVVDDDKRDKLVKKQQKDLKEKFRKNRQKYLDDIKVKDKELYKKESKIGNQYEEKG